MPCQAMLQLQLTPCRLPCNHFAVSRPLSPWLPVRIAYDVWCACRSCNCRSLCQSVRPGICRRESCNVRQALQGIGKVCPCFGHVRRTVGHFGLFPSSYCSWGCCPSGGFDVHKMRAFVELFLDKSGSNPRHVQARPVALLFINILRFVVKQKLPIHAQPCCVNRLW